MSLLAESGSLITAGTPWGAAVIVLAGVTCLATAFNQGQQLVMRLLGRDPQERHVGPQPFEISAAPVYVTAAELKLRHDALTERLAGAERVIEAIRVEARQDRAAMVAALQEVERRISKDSAEREGNTHERINDLLKEVGKLIGEVQAGRKVA